MTFLQGVNFLLCGMMMSLMVTGIAFSAIIQGVKSWDRKFFIALFTVLTLLVGSFAIDTFSTLYSTATAAIVGRITVFLEYFFLPVITLMSVVYLLHCCNEDWRESKIFRAEVAVYVVFVILLVVTQFTGIFYYVTEENIFCRNELHPILMLPMDVISLLNLSAVFNRRKNLSRRYFSAFVINSLPLAVTIMIHTIIFEPVLIAAGITFSAVSMYVIILLDNVEQFFYQQANILALQMRPHFIYNTMTSIYYLCSQNPQQAQKVTLDFTNYLRKNFTAIAHEGPIPFSEELEHTKAYLAIERAQFEENLFVEYDTPNVNFKIPPLTLQPIVENCVKHGLDPEAEPLHILISTRETKSGNVIVVEDDGVGFEVDEGGENFALKNIQKRLEMFCGGDLKIYPREFGGTVVKVFIPFARQLSYG